MKERRNGLSRLLHAKETVISSGSVRHFGSTAALPYLFSHTTGSHVKPTAASLTFIVKSKLYTYHAKTGKLPKLQALYISYIV